jgi:hypothetical protein
MIRRVFFMIAVPVFHTETHMRACSEIASGAFRQNPPPVGASALDGAKAAFSSGRLSMVWGGGFWMLRSLLNDGAPGHSSARGALQ